MRSTLLVLAGTLVWPSAAHAQGHDWQVGGVAVATGTEFVGGGPGFGWRTSLRTRLGVTAAVGESAGRLAGRFEGSLTYYVNPLARRGSPYAGGGLAVTATEAAVVEYVALFVGMEGNPRGRVRWFAEAGVSGGLRVALGLRLRI